MTIVNFTPWTALIGGACIGAGALLLMLAAGKTAGISGIVSGIATQADKHWRLAFVLGLILVPGVLFATQLVAVPELASMSVVKLVLAGLLVGVGTRLGNGCTSGHGICGIGRFSWRSLVATVVFMVAGIATVSALGWGA
ncbi:MAG: YeeE/YedE family protein [Oceanisphaera sp.]|uniref:YeeE/YedE family protein n=1 Tax=Oceanisphaera sp. TaxID=1929979 RepID=UPI003F99CD31